MNLKRKIMIEYRRVHDANPEVPFLHARDALPERLGLSYEELAPLVQDLEKNRFLHWKAKDLYKLSPRGVRVTGDPAEFEREFPEG